MTILAAQHSLHRKERGICDPAKSKNPEGGVRDSWPRQVEDPRQERGMFHPGGGTQDPVKLDEPSSRANTAPPGLTAGGALLRIG
jgi:hypothetical protein